jgi:hypothetical protein
MPCCVDKGPCERNGSVKRVNKTVVTMGLFPKSERGPRSSHFQFAQTTEHASSFSVAFTGCDGLCVGSSVFRPSTPFLLFSVVSLSPTG